MLIFLEPFHDAIIPLDKMWSFQSLMIYKYPNGIRATLSTSSHFSKVKKKLQRQRCLVFLPFPFRKNKRGIEKDITLQWHWGWILKWQRNLPSKMSQEASCYIIQVLGDFRECTVFDKGLLHRRHYNYFYIC